MKTLLLVLVATLTANAAMAQTYPLTIPNKFGTTVVEQAPERFASVDFAGADDLLALGIQPVTIRHWYGNYPRSVWPWADPLLEADNPVILRGQLDFEAIAAAHPEWDGLGVAVAYLFDGTLGAYTSRDVRPQVLAELGFQPPAQIDALIVGNDFAVTFSPEDLSAIDTDLLIWLPPQGGDIRPILDMPSRRFLEPVRKGQEIFLDEELSGAFSHASLLSIAYAIDRLVPMIEAVLE